MTVSQYVPDKSVRCNKDLEDKKALDISVLDLVHISFLEKDRCH